MKKMSSDRVELLRKNLLVLGITIGLFGLIYLLFIIIPSYFYIQLEDSLDIFRDTVTIDPDTAATMIDEICTNLMIYNVSFSVSILLVGTSLSVISFYAGKILEMFDWKTSKKIFYLIGFLLLGVSTLLAILNLVLYFTLAYEMRQYLLEYVASGTEPSLPKKSLLYLLVSYLVQANYFFIGIVMVIIFTTLDAFSGQIGLFKMAKNSFKFLSIGAFVYIIEMFIGVPISIIIIPVGALLTSRNLRKIEKVIGKYQKKKKQ